MSVLISLVTGNLCEREVCGWGGNIIEGECQQVSGPYRFVTRVERTVSDSVETYKWVLRFTT